jgi:hypothetical protein
MVEYPKWAREDYEGVEEDFTEWLRQVARDTIFNELIEKTKGDEGALAQTNAMIEHWVMSRTKDLTQTTERAFVYQLFEADRTGWFHYLPGELDTIEELLASMLDDLEDESSKYYDYKFIVETLMPMLRQAGAKPEDVWGLTTSVSKARAAVPLLRELLHEIPENEQPPPETQEKILDVARKISDPSVTVRPFRDDIAQERGKKVQALQPIPIEKFFMPGGEQWYLIKAPSEAYARTIELGVRGITRQVDVKDAFALILQVAGLVRKPIKHNGNSPKEIEKLRELLLSD